MKIKTLEKAVRFDRKDAAQFFSTLNKRVSNYFTTNKLPKTGTLRLYLKALVMFSLWIAPFVLLFTTTWPGWVKLFLLCPLMGIGMAGVGMNVMHDGNHGSFSRYSWVNKFMGASIYLLAGNVHNWKVQHNILHHTFTNIPGHDEDLEAGRIIRFSKESKWYPLHQYQHIYAFFVYGLLTINWVLTADFNQIKRYLERGLTYRKKLQPLRQWMILISTKILYFFVWIFTPMVWTDLPWWGILMGFFIMHYTAGLILSLVFQLAHVVEETTMPLPDQDTQKMKNSWAVHQLLTTTNFSTNNRFLNWFTGGLNHQIEHHIFPNISHIHYTEIAKIVKKTAKEFNLPYLEYKSTLSALFSHYQHLKNMGVAPR